MSPPEFDQHSQSYELLLKDPIRDRFSGLHSEFFQLRKADLILEHFRRKGLDTSTMTYLDVGCGKGDLLRILEPSFASVTGCDPSSGMLTFADNIETRLQTDENKLPFDDESFDFASASGVFHHVPPGKRIALAKEVLRVLKPRGVFALVEHNPLNPVTQLIVSRTPVDKEAILLGTHHAKGVLSAAGFHISELRYFLYLPKAAFDRGGKTIEYLLAKIPLGGQYAIFAIKNYDR